MSYHREPKIIKSLYKVTLSHSQIKVRKRDEGARKGTICL